MLGVLRCKVLVSTDNTLGLIFSSQKIIKKQKPLKLFSYKQERRNNKGQVCTPQVTQPTGHLVWRTAEFLKKVYRKHCANVRRKANQEVSFYWSQGKGPQVLMCATNFHKH